MAAAEIEIELHRRVHRTRSGRPALSFFDGPTMVGYQVPHKAFETVYCRSEVEPWECGEYRGIDPSYANVPISHLEARKSTVGDFAGRELFAAKDIPMHSTFDIGDGVKAFQILPSSWSVIEGLCERAKIDEKYGHVEDELSSVYTFGDGTSCLSSQCHKMFIVANYSVFHSTPFIGYGYYAVMLVSAGSQIKLIGL